MPDRLTPSEARQKRTMTLNLTDAEMTVLDELSAKMDLSKTAVLRQALRLYQAVHVRQESGERIVFSGPDKTTELLVL